MLHRINGERILPQKNWRLLWLWIPSDKLLANGVEKTQTISCLGKWLPPHRELLEMARSLDDRKRALFVD